jgi:glycosyltransferase involved in cell wall biosynthesis
LIVNKPAMQDSGISIGVLAHNEEAHIGAALRSLFAQDVFDSYAVEVVIVANACVDQTVEIAESVLAEHHPVWNARGSARVVEISTPGKTNAWNLFVHELSSRSASILILMDADIELLSSNSLSSMVSTLERNSGAIVCVDRHVKDIEIKENPTLFERLLIAATPKLGVGRVPLCGQLYCVRSAQGRMIRLPLEITVDDGFLRALLLTRGFTAAEDANGIVLDPHAAHSFSSVSTLRELFKHERWLIAGSIVNMLLFERFSAQAVSGQSAMTLMERWDAEDVDWLPRYIESEVRRRGWALLPREYWVRRWARLKGLPARSAVLRAPAAAIAAMVDAMVFIAAIRDVRRGRAYRYWGRNRPQPSNV